MKHTSYIAGQYITDSGRAETLKEKVYNLIRKYPNITQREITESYGESARKRVHELVKDGLVFENGTRKIERLNYITYIAADVIQQNLLHNIHTNTPLAEIIA